MLTEYAHLFDLAAGVNFLANFLTGVAYTMIPWEIRKWFMNVDIKGMWGVAVLFMAFILTCGVHHYIMAFSAPHSVPQLAADVAMMIVSAFAAAGLQRNRPQIKGVMEFVSHCLADRAAIEEIWNRDKSQ